MAGSVSRFVRSMMAALAGKHFNGDRDMYDICGYPRDVGAEDFRAVYQRGDIAGRIIDSFPDATWREPPTVKPRGPDGKTIDGSEFEKAFEQLCQRLNLWGTLHRLDTLTGLGHYGVLMLGLNGAEDPAQPARGTYQLMYLTPHGEGTADITNWDQDPRSPRYAQPLAYRLSTGVSWTGVGGAQRSITCHWSRAVHVAERALEDKAIGVPRLERIFNRLMDLDKMLGGGAEVWWQNAAQLRAWIADADAQFSTEDKAEMEAQLEELQHKLRRDVRLRGVKPESLAAGAQSAEAATTIDRLLDIIAGAIGIPKRILIGSERGELSSEQDENNWAARIQERRQHHATPNIIRPLVDLLMGYGVLPRVADYDVVWPESDVLGEAARADIASKKATAVQAYMGTPGADSIIAPEEFRRWLGEEEVSEYQLAPEPEELPEPALDQLPPDPAVVDESAEAVIAFNRRLVLVDNAAPRTLYVRRQVLNWRELAKWAKAQGFGSTLGEAMHVTVAFSRTPVDWLKVSEAWSQTPGDLSGNLDIAAGGPRVIQKLGDKGAAVLSFASNDLRWRHESICAAGASWDFAQYEPHVTISYKTDGIDLGKVEPYTGAIELGPELFEEVDEDWSEAITERDT